MRTQTKYTIRKPANGILDLLLFLLDNFGFRLWLHYFYVVGVALFETSLRDSDEVCFAAKLGNILRPAIAHA